MSAPEAQAPARAALHGSRNIVPDARQPDMPHLRHPLPLFRKPSALRDRGEGVPNADPLAGKRRGPEMTEARLKER